MELSEDDKEFLRRRELFEPMLKTDAWKEFEKILMSQVEAHTQQMLLPADTSRDGLSHSLVTEFRKGAVFGITTAIKTPYATIKTAEELLQNRQNVKEPEYEHSIVRPVQQPGFDNISGDELPEYAVVTDLGGE